MSASGSISSSGSTPPDGGPQPRLCRITKWHDFDGYGFHLQAIKSKPGQFIGKIDEDSPAEAAGLRQGDRIIEVNGVNINNENHVQVVERIKANAKTVDLLVVDPQCHAFYIDRNLVVQSSWDNVLVLANKPRGGSLNGSVASSSPSPAPSASPTPSSASGRSKEEKLVEEVKGMKIIEEAPVVTKIEPKHVQLPVAAPTPEEPEKDSQGPVLEFDKMSAAEMRARLASRKRADPRQENLSAKQKHQIIQAL